MYHKLPINILKSIILLEVFACTQICIQANKCTAPGIPRYHLTEKCNRSKLGIAAKANFVSLTSCRRLGIEKKALAINFMPTSQGRSLEEHSCEVLKCAEVEGGLALSNDTRYDYYSIYARPIPNVNTTCVPAIGMFYLFESQLNYTQAQSQCGNMSGVLADVTSEQRTDALAQVLTGAGVSAAYIGMTRTNGSAFISIHGNALDCSTYRAWAPGHPQNKWNHSCVILTKQHTWKTTNCKSIFPSLCELTPNGPYKKGSKLPSLINVMNSTQNNNHSQKTNKE